MTTNEEQRQYYCPVKIHHAAGNKRVWRFCGNPLPCKGHQIEDELDGAYKCDGVVLFDPPDVKLR